jgi:hypothetical protein
VRYLILSDIHANVTALQAALSAAEGRWDRPICLGDIVGYGPDPNEAVDQIRALNPDVNNFDHLEAGQLIRLPLPPGTLKKVIDTANPSETTEPGKWQLAVAKIKGLYSNAKR